METDCWDCQGEGVRIVCPDSLCRASKSCMHGDGERVCSVCDGDGVVDGPDTLDDLCGDGVFDGGLWEETTARCCVDCGCTDDHACSPTCCWADEDRCCQCALEQGQVCPNCGTVAGARDDNDCDDDDNDCDDEESELPF